LISGYVLFGMHLNYSQLFFFELKNMFHVLVAVFLKKPGEASK